MKQKVREYRIKGTIYLSIDKDIRLTEAVKALMKYNVKPTELFKIKIAENENAFLFEIIKKSVLNEETQAT